jgi:hypothetical protein
MNVLEAKQLIDELIELSNTKYGFLKVGRDTLTHDILFIEKYEELKEIIGAASLENIDPKDLPRIKDLKEIISLINDFEIGKQNKNVRMTKALGAYKK